MKNISIALAGVGLAWLFVEAFLVKDRSLLRETLAILLIFLGGFLNLKYRSKK